MNADTRAMRLTSIFLVVLVAVSPAFFVNESMAAVQDGIFISEVQPKGTEGFSLYNGSTYQRDLKGYYLTDGEGDLVFTKSLIIAPLTDITISFDTDAVQTFLERPGDSGFFAYEVGTFGITADKSFKLADAGDGLCFYSPKKVFLDSVCWGNVTAEGWNGPVADKPTNDRYLVRFSLTDTDSAADWRLSRPGMTDRIDGVSFIADVTPFTFPECHGAEIYNALESAREEVLISIYQITSRNTMALLCLLAERGVDVNILLEGSPLGDKGQTNTERTMMKCLVESGGTITLINDPRSQDLSDSGNRFTYVHTKYAVIDGKTTIITSENWTESNMGTGNGNRGWGAVFESEDYAKYMREIFFNDSSTAFGDCKDMLALYPEQTRFEGGLIYSDPGLTHDDSHESMTFRDCSVSPILSPDNSYESLRSFIEGSETRAYAQQMDLSDSYLGISEDSPVSWMVDSASRGVDCRLLLDITNDTGGKSAEIGLINTTTRMKAAGINGGEGFWLTHNKGVIVDDSVWIGSVNWTDTSFFRNREAAVIIKSPDVADYYSSYFLEDWNNNDRSGKIAVEISRFDNRLPGDFGFFEVEIAPKGDYEYVWDIYGDGRFVRRSSIPKISYDELEPGKHTLVVTVIEEDTGRSAVAMAEYIIDEQSPGTDSINVNSVYLAIIVSASVAVLGTIRAERTRDSREKRKRRNR
ncbi:MAG: phospholipase D-like domain-containing protein [Methanomassiliicoccaceae archaeon]|nr:phospholipase D-like domain-containing protein [Methanomassiliicoccaceae archaeon]